MKFFFRKYRIIIPLHLPLNHITDYINQTGNILSKNNQVILFDLNYPLSWKELYSQTKFFNYFNSILDIASGKNKVLYFRPISLFPLQKISLFLRINKFFGVLQLRFILFLCRGKKFLWGFHPILGFLIDRFGSIPALYDCIDYLGSEETEYLKFPEKKLFQKASLIFFNSHPLREKKIQENPFIGLDSKSYVVPCGCRWDLFGGKKRTAPSEYRDIKNWRVIFAGHIDYRIDFDLLDYIIAKNKKLVFIFLGPIAKESQESFQQLSYHKNVLYLGLKKKEQLIKYMQNADIGIIPYRTDYNTVKYCNPMKAYEYLASGIPVLSTKIKALEKYSEEIIYKTNDYRKFHKALYSLCRTWDSKKKTRAKLIAKANSWQQKINWIEKYISAKYD